MHKVYKKQTFSDSVETNEYSIIFSNNLVLNKYSLSSTKFSIQYREAQSLEMTFAYVRKGNPTFE